jgi:arabinose-5-phosphate isomerase
VVGVTANVGDALHAITLHKTGAAFVVDKGVVKGVFTDGDLRRHAADENLFGQRIIDVMTGPCRTVHVDKLAPEAVLIIQETRIGELPAIDDAGKIRGHVALKDLVAMHFI